MQTREIRCVFNVASSHKSSDVTFSMALFQERKKRLVIIIVTLILERVLVIKWQENMKLKQALIHK